MTSDLINPEQYIQDATGLTYRDVSPQAIQFAEACYNDNTLKELVAAVLTIPPDNVDCKTWNITDKEWLWAIYTAMVARKVDGSIDGRGRVVI